MKGFTLGKAIMDDKSNLIFDVAARKGSQGICSVCGSRGPSYDSLPRRLFQFVPIWGRQVYFAYSMRRVNCPSCGGIKVESVPWGEGKSPHTKHYMIFLAHWAKILSWKSVATEFHATWDTVYNAVRRAVEYGLPRRKIEDVKSIGVDELQWKGGHKYITAVWQLNGRKRLLWLGMDRTKATFESFFNEMEKIRKGFCKQIKHMCSDMWKPYMDVAAKRIPSAINILDRFHVMMKFSKAIDEVRADEARRLKAEGQEPVLAKSKWLFLKNKINLTVKESFRLKDLLSMNLRTVKAYLLKEQFQQFWEFECPALALRFLDTWCAKALVSRIEPMVNVAKTLQSHRVMLMNWFIAKKEFNSGMVEGLNLKAKNLFRRAFGYKSFKVVEAALLHSLGDLPNEPLKHRLW